MIRYRRYNTVTYDQHIYIKCITSTTSNQSPTQAQPSHRDKTTYTLTQKRLPLLRLGWFIHDIYLYIYYPHQPPKPHNSYRHTTSFAVPLFLSSFFVFSWMMMNTPIPKPSLLGVHCECNVMSKNVVIEKKRKQTS